MIATNEARALLPTQGTPIDDVVGCADLCGVTNADAVADVGADVDKVQMEFSG